MAGITTSPQLRESPERAKVHALFDRACPRLSVSGMSPVHSVRHVPGPYPPGAPSPPPAQNCKFMNNCDLGGGYT